MLLASLIFVPGPPIPLQGAQKGDFFQKKIFLPIDWKFFSDDFGIIYFFFFEESALKATLANKRLTAFFVKLFWRIFKVFVFFDQF